MTEQLTLTPADRLRAMADALDRNPGGPFGGVAVIVPPDNGGEALELLILDSQKDPAQFWSTVVTRASLMVQDLQQKTVAFGRR